MTGVLIRKEDNEETREMKSCKDGEEDAGVLLSEVKECQEMPQAGTHEGCSLRTSGSSITLSKQWFQISNFQKCDSTNVSCFKPSLYPI